MKLIKEDGTRKWYLVKEWVTQADLPARIHQCVWNRELMPDLSLHDHYTGYVQLPVGKTISEAMERDLDVHGGITFSESSFSMSEAAMDRTLKQFYGKSERLRSYEDNLSVQL